MGVGQPFDMALPFFKKRVLPNPQPSSLGSLLVVLSISQILITGAVVAILAFRGGQNTINQVAQQLRNELVIQIELELKRYFESPPKLNQLNAAAYRRGDLDIVGASKGEAFLYQQLKQFPNISFAYCGGPQGEFFGVLHEPTDEQYPYQVSYSNATTNGLRQYYGVNRQGDRDAYIRQRSDRFDSRDRPWYERALLEQAPTWTNVYFGFTSNLPNITASTPVYDSNRQLLGVCATDVLLPQEFRQFLQSLEIGGSGQAFIIDREGYLIADSTDESLSIGSGDERRSRFGKESNEPLIKKASQTLHQQYGETLEEISGAESLEFGFNQKRHFLDLLPFTDDAGLDWIIVVVFPEDRFMAQMWASMSADRHRTLLSISIAICISLGIGVWVARSVAFPILSINTAAKELAKGNWNKRVPLQRHDEIGELAQSFNHMAQALQQSFSALEKQKNFLEKQKNAFARFFPPEYLHFLKKSDVTEVVLGEHVSKEMAVMFSDIRNFTSLAETLTPQESFDFINEYLRYVSPEISKNNGFVVKFLGDGLMAVFPEDADNAVKAGIAKFNKIQEFNQHRQRQGLSTIKVGVGLHMGHIMVGMIGDHNRLQADALSDCVNLSARLEGLTKVYDAPFLISTDVVTRLEDTHRYELRRLGQVIVKGRTKAIHIYEVLDVLEPFVRDLKIQTRDLFHQAILHYRLADFQEAKQLFEAVRSQNPTDKVVNLYIDRISTIMHQNISHETWTGAWVFTNK